MTPEERANVMAALKMIEDLQKEVIESYSTCRNAAPVDIEALVDAVGAALGVDTGACHENQFSAACDIARIILRNAGALRGDPT